MSSTCAPEDCKSYLDCDQSINKITKGDVMFHPKDHIRNQSNFKQKASDNTLSSNELVTPVAATRMERFIRENFKVLDMPEASCTNDADEQKFDLSMLSNFNFPSLHRNQWTKACISFFSDPDHIWIRVDDSAVVQFENLLNRFYNCLIRNPLASGLMAVSSKIITDSLRCCVLLPDSPSTVIHQFRRAEVVGTYGDIVQLVLIDSGQELETEIGMIKTLHESFFEIAPQALQCSLSNVKPAFSKWTKGCIQYISTQLKSSLATYVKLDSKDDIEVMIVDERGNRVNLNKALVEKGFASWNEASNIKGSESDTSLNSATSSCDEHANADSKRIYYPIEADLLGSEVEVTACEASAPDDFLLYVHSKSRNAAYLHLKSALKKTFADEQNITVPSKENLYVGMPCAFFSESLEAWVRASLVKMTSIAKLQLLLVDHGIFVDTHLEQVKILPVELITNCPPPIVIRCTLRGFINPLSNTWSNDDVTKFKAYFTSRVNVKIRCRVYGVVQKLGEAVHLYVCSLHTSFLSLGDVLTGDGSCTHCVPVGEVYPPYVLSSYIRSHFDTDVGSVLHVRITHVESSNLFYCQLKSNKDCRKRLNEQIQVYCNSSSVLTESALTNSPTALAEKMCLAEFEGRWLRAYMISHCTGNERVGARVFFVDKGFTRDLPFTRIRCMPNDKFIGLPIQAIPCSLAGLSAVSDEKGNSLESWMKENLSGKILQMKLARFIGKKWDVYLNKEGENLNKTAYEFINPNQYHKQTSNNTTTQQKSEEVSVTKLLTNLTELQDLEFISPITVGQNESVHVVHCIDPNEFFVTLDKSLMEVQHFESHLDSFYNAVAAEDYRVHRLERGNMVCVQTNGTWKRGLVVDITMHRIQLFLPDYGRIVSVVNHTCLRRLDTMKRWPVMALRCSLEVISDSSSGWSSRVTSYFENLVRNTPLRIVFIKQQSGTSKWLVRLFLGNISVGTDLITKRFAKSPTETGKVPANNSVKRYMILKESATTKQTTPVTDRLLSTDSNDNAVSKDVNSPEKSSQSAQIELSSSKGLPDMRKDFKPCPSNNTKIARKRAPSSTKLECPAIPIQFTSPTSYTVKSTKTASSVLTSSDDAFSFDEHNSFQTCTSSVGSRKKRKQLADCSNIPHQYTVPNNNVDRKAASISSIGSEETSSDVDGNHSNIPIQKSTSEVGSRKPSGMKYPPNNDYPKRQFSCDRTECAVFISCVRSPCTVCIQLESDAKGLQTVMLDLNEDLKNGRTKTKFNIGDICAARYSADDKFYRAKILKIIGENCCKVCFIDYGNCETVTYHDIYLLPTKFSWIPAFMIVCEIYISPQFAKCDNAVDLMEELAASDHVTLFASICNLLDSNKANIATLEVISANRKKKVSLNKYLVTQVSHHAKKETQRNLFSSTSNEIVQPSFSSGYVASNDRNKSSGFDCSEVKLPQRKSVVMPQEDNTTNSCKSAVSGSPCKVESLVEYTNEFAPTLRRSNLESSNVDFNTDQLPEDSSFISASQFYSGQDTKHKPNVDRASDVLDQLTDDELPGSTLHEEPPACSDKLKDLPDEYIIEGTCTDTIVSFANGPRSFYLQFQSRQNDLLELHNLMNKFYTGSASEDLVLNGSNINEQLFAVNSMDNDLWYRANLVDLTDGTPRVQFVDYGTYSLISYDRIRKLHPKFSSFSPFAVHCCLNQVSDESYQDEASKDAFTKALINQSFNAEFVFRRKEIWFVNLSSGKDIVLAPKDMAASSNENDYHVNDNVKINSGASGSLLEDIQDGQDDTAKSALIIQSDFKAKVWAAATEKDYDVKPKVDGRNVLNNSGISNTVDITVGSHDTGYMSYALGTSNFYVHLNITEEILENMYEELNNSDAISVLPRDDVQDGCYCLAQCPDDDVWYRAKCMGFADDQVEVMFVDYGNCSTVLYSKLRPLDKRYAKHPACAVPCTLYGFHFFASSDKTEIDDTFSELILEKQLQVHFKSISEKDEKRWSVQIMVDGIDVCTVLQDKFLPDASLKQEQPVATLAAAAADDDDIINVSCDSLPALVKVDAHHEEILRREKILSIEDQFCAVQTTSNPLPVEEIDINKDYKMYVSFAVGMNEFYLQLASKEQALETLQEDLNVTHESVISSSIMIDDQSTVFCIAKSPDDEQWYRACILSREKSSALVKFIDYGNTSTVPSEWLKPLNNLFVTHPPLAIECCLEKLSADKCCEKKFLNTVMDSELSVVFLQVAEDDKFVVKIAMGGKDICSVCPRVHDGGSSDNTPTGKVKTVPLPNDALEPALPTSGTEPLITSSASVAISQDPTLSNQLNEIPSPIKRFEEAPALHAQSEDVPTSTNQLPETTASKIDSSLLATKKEPEPESTHLIVQPQESSSLQTSASAKVCFSNKTPSSPAKKVSTAHTREQPKTPIKAMRERTISQSSCRSPNKAVLACKLTASPSKTPRKNLVVNPMDFVDPAVVKHPEPPKQLSNEQAEASVDVPSGCIMPGCVDVGKVVKINALNDFNMTLCNNRTQDKIRCRLSAPHPIRCSQCAFRVHLSNKRFVVEFVSSAKIDDDQVIWEVRLLHIGDDVISMVSI